MAEAAAAAEGAEGAPEGGKKKALVPILTFAGALLGGLVASLVVAPKIIARQAPPPVAAEQGAEGEGEAAPAEGEGKEKEGEGGEKKLVELSNIIVNPAGSQGTRFLMASVAFAVPDPESEKVLREHEVELRDKVTSVLEVLTMAQLTSPGARDSLKTRIGQVATAVIGKKVPVQVFLPQFVIQ